MVDEGDVESIVHRKGFLAKKIKNILPVAIIDEFQDTDPVQFEIVKSIYLSDDENDSADNKDGSAGAVSKSDFWGFYIVGDPKQSIYGFRGADLHCYNVAKRIILDRYRSEDEKAEHKIGTTWTKNRPSHISRWRMSVTVSSTPPTFSMA